MHIALESPDQPEVLALIAELDAYQDSLYPPECRYALDLASLKQSNVLFCVVRDAAGTAIACGAMVLYDGYAELKRMVVGEAWRGRGVARALLAALEAHAQEAGRCIFRLETGPLQPPALGFYADAGYARRAAYGDYREDPMSVFMEKTVDLQLSS